MSAMPCFSLAVGKARHGRWEIRSLYVVVMLYGNIFSTYEMAYVVKTAHVWKLFRIDDEVCSHVCEIFILLCRCSRVIQEHVTAVRLKLDLDLNLFPVMPGLLIDRNFK